MDVRGKLVELLLQEDDVCNPNECKDCGANGSCYYHRTADKMIAHGVTVQECCRKAESAISKTGLMCTACHSDIDRDAVFCKYCGANVMPQPPKGE